MTAQQAAEAIRRALDRREATFLALARRRIYATPSSPYRALLANAGCDFADLQAEVAHRGLPETLTRLAAAGVYLTSDEFKGKVPVKRGALELRVRPQDFDRGGRAGGFGIQSSGTTNDPVRAFIPLDWLAARALATAVFFAAHGLERYAHAVYDAPLPASPALNNLLLYARIGTPAERWFTRRMPVNSRLEGAYHAALTWLAVGLSRACGAGLPAPEPIEHDDLRRIVRWVLETSRRGRPCCVTGPASGAVRIARAAQELGVTLRGTRFVVSGEAFTEAKQAQLARVEACGVTRYAFGGGLNVGFGCAQPAHLDEIHVNEHLCALIAHPTPLAEHDTIYPLLGTTVHPLAPRFLLNVANGDYATLLRRDCGCALERAGLTLHLHRIRSFEKFTSEGMNYAYADLYHLLESVLPAEFGGGPGDYQLVEAEDAAGLPRLTLRVDPAVASLDEARLLARLQAALAEAPRAERFMARLWQMTGTVTIERRAPHASGRGKILPLHLPRQA